MADRLSSPVGIDGPSRGRRHSVLSEFLPGSLPVYPEFVDPASNVQEILTKDIADCSSDDEAGHGHGASSPVPAGDEANRDHDVQLAFHPTGVAFGSGFSSIPIPGLDLPVHNPHEVEESLLAEVSLLRDNHILPPKHARTGWRASSIARLYRSWFGTKVHQDKVPEEPSETTQLLHGRTARYDHGPVPPTPSADEVHRQWDEAVAAHLIETSWQREAKTLVQYSVPMIVTFLLHYSVTVASVLTVGRLGMEELAAVNCKFTPH